MRRIAALVVAAGSGERFGGTQPKQYLPLMGKPVVQWSIDAFQKHPMILDVYVVIHPEHKNYLQHPHTVTGGNTRQESVRLGLEALRATKPDFVLIHDAARPLISDELITALCGETSAAVPALPVTDTIRRNGKTESRDGLYTTQTPQAFPFDLIDDLHQKHKDKSFTDDAALCEAEGHTVKIISGQRDNIKITHAEDFPLAEQYLSSRLGDVRMGQGYDVHRFVSSLSRKLMLCGISIPHDKILEGHSDADVGLHAITDAILGTIGDGDIGHHFSPTDARWKNADSAVFLKHAAELVARQGGIISHVDVTLICEAPKIAPHRESMRQKIADILGLPLHRISVKATTTEGLGFTGRGEGIAAQAVATVRLPFTLREQKKEELKWAS